MGEAIHKINEKLLDMHTEIVNRTHFINAGQNPNDMLEIINFVKIVYHDIYDVWRASSLSNEYYYNILLCLDKYVSKISFNSLMLVEEEEYEDLWCVLDDLIVFLQEEYDYFDLDSILGDFETAADVFSAALVIPVKNIYARLVELRQLLNMLYNDNPYPVDDSMILPNANTYFDSCSISSNKSVIVILTYSLPSDDDKRRRLFSVPNMDPEEPEFDDFVAELGGVYDGNRVRRMIRTRGSEILQNTLKFIDYLATSLEDDQIVNCDYALQHVYCSLFMLLILKDLSIEQIVINLLELLKLIPLHELFFVSDAREAQTLILHVIYLTNELNLKNLGISSIDSMHNYAKILYLVKMRVLYPELNLTADYSTHYVYADGDEQSTENKMMLIESMKYRTYDTLKQVVVSIGIKHCSLCKSSRFVKKFGLCVHCPHLLCCTCLEYWINKSATFTCPVCRMILPKVYFGQDFKALKGILASTDRKSAKIVKEFQMILRGLF